MCRVLEVSRSGYYAWADKDRPTSRDVADSALGDAIEEIHSASRGTYGRPRLVVELNKKGHAVGKHRVARLMRERGVRGRVQKKFCKTTDSDHDDRVAPNLLDRNFDVQTPDTAWCGDITYVWTDVGFVYLAVVIDLATRLVVGWCMDDHMRTDLVERALDQALGWREPADGMIFHSDRGSVYTSKDYRDKLDEHGILASMSRKGDCWDNAVSESFFGTYKQEEVDCSQWSGLLEARAATHDYIECFYNRSRLHSSLGYRTPIEVDNEHQQRQPA